MVQSPFSLRDSDVARWRSPSPSRFCFLLVLVSLVGGCYVDAGGIAFVDGGDIDGEADAANASPTSVPPPLDGAIGLPQSAIDSATTGASVEPLTDASPLPPPPASPDAAVEVTPLPDASAPAPDAAAPPAPGPDMGPIRKALLLVGDDNLGASDKILRDKLVSLGFSVDRAPARTNEEAMTASRGVPGHDLVVLSSSLPQGTGLPKQVRDFRIPIICLKPEFLDNLEVGLTMNGQTPDQKQIAIVAPKHPMADGRSGAVTIFQQPTALAWGRPLPGALTVAITTGDAEAAVIFGLEVGTPAMSGPTPARRVAWLMLDEAIPRLNAEGWALFSAAVSWVTQ